MGDNRNSHLLMDVDSPQKTVTVPNNLREKECV